MRTEIVDIIWVVEWQKETCGIMTCGMNNQETFGMNKQETDRRLLSALI